MSVETTGRVMLFEPGDRVLVRFGGFGCVGGLLQSRQNEFCFISTDDGQKFWIACRYVSPEIESVAVEQLSLFEL